MSSSNSNIISSDSNLKRCAACRYLRRRCSQDCVLSPYFPASNPLRFSCVHRIFGASNVARMLQQLPEHQRAQAAEAISSEAYWRVHSPVYGSAGIISQLQQDIYVHQRELALTQAQIATRAAQQQYRSISMSGSVQLLTSGSGTASSSAIGSTWYDGGGKYWRLLSSHILFLRLFRYSS